MTNQRWIRTRPGASLSRWAQDGWAVTCQRETPETWRMEVACMDCPLETHQLEAANEPEARTFAMEILRTARHSHPES
jgi:hypothetical protein